MSSNEAIHDLLGSMSAVAQNFRRGINGVVTDKTGAVLANASVVVTDVKLPISANKVIFGAPDSDGSETPVFSPSATGL